MIEYVPYERRRLDEQYEDRLRTIWLYGETVPCPQGVPALTCFGTLPQMVFDLRNGVPLITTRKAPWKAGIAEILAFINGVRSIDELVEWGVPDAFWGPYRDGVGLSMGLAGNDLGPGSYGAAFHDFPMPDGQTFNQFAHVVDQLKRFPNVRTIRVSVWIPFYNGRGGVQKAIVSPCHGDLFFYVFEGRDGKKYLDMEMKQRSADFPIGVPSNMIQYSALLLAIAQVTGLHARRFIHSFSNAHIYENQLDAVMELLKRRPRRFPTLVLDPTVTDLFAFRIGHFTLEDYCPHPPLKIPYLP